MKYGNRNKIVLRILERQFWCKSNILYNSDISNDSILINDIYSINCDRKFVKFYNFVDCCLSNKILVYLFGILLFIVSPCSLSFWDTVIKCYSIEKWYSCLCCKKSHDLINYIKLYKVILLKKSEKFVEYYLNISRILDKSNYKKDVDYKNIIKVIVSYI